jgi:hypothetical protein
MLCIDALPPVFAVYKTYDGRWLLVAPNHDHGHPPTGMTFDRRELKNFQEAPVTQSAQSVIFRLYPSPSSFLQY